MRSIGLGAAALALILAGPAQPLAAESRVGPLGLPVLPKSEVLPGRVLVRFMGTSTLLLDDGTTQILIDGFFSRPSVGKLLLGRIASDDTAVKKAMARAGIGSRLKAVLVAHSHYDHALDAPAIAQRTGARLAGSLSTLRIGRGAGLPVSRMDRIGHGRELDYGDFHVTVFRSIHSPNMRYEGDVSASFTPPERVESYREGGSYSFLVRHRGGLSILIHPSANVPPKLYKDVRADVAFIGIGTLGNQSAQFANDYSREVVGATGPRLVIPIHWDNLTRSLDEDLRLPSKLVDNVPRAIERLRSHANLYRATLREMPLFDPVDVEALAR